MNFDRLAPHYDWMEAVSAGRLLQRVRTTWLDALAGCRRVLSAGEGHGRFAAAFGPRFPGAGLTCIDASAAMLRRARRRVAGTVPQRDPIWWVHADVLDWQSAGATFDGIVTCFFLDCFPPDLLGRVVRKLADCATSDARWITVDFAVPPRGLARRRAEAIHSLMYSFFRHTTGLPARRLTSPDGLLTDAGFELVGRREYSCGLLRADLWRRRIRGDAGAGSAESQAA